MLVPHLVGRPGVGGGHELLEAVVRGERRGARLAVHPVVSLALVVCLEVQVAVRAAPADIAGVGLRLVAAVTRVVGLDVLPQPVVQGFDRRALVFAAPQGDARVVAHLLDLLDGIRPEDLQVDRRARGVEPEVIPDHHAVAVAGVVEGLVGGHADPVADHVEVHLPVEAQARVVVPAAAAQHELRHAPVAALGEDAHAVDVEVQELLGGVVGDLAHAEGGRPGVGNAAAGLEVEPAGVQVGLAVAVGPPETRTGEVQGRDSGGVELDGFRLVGPERHGLGEGDLTRREDAPQHAVDRRAGVVLHLDLDGNLRLRGIGG